MNSAEYTQQTRVVTSMKRISNHSEQRLFREEILSFIQEKANAFSTLFEQPMAA